MGVGMWYCSRDSTDRAVNKEAKTQDRQWRVEVLDRVHTSSDLLVFIIYSFLAL